MKEWLRPLTRTGFRTTTDSIYLLLWPSIPDSLSFRELSFLTWIAHVLWWSRLWFMRSLHSGHHVPSGCFPFHLHSYLVKGRHHMDHLVSTHIPSYSFWARANLPTLDDQSVISVKSVIHFLATASCTQGILISWAPVIFYN